MSNERNRIIKLLCKKFNNLGDSNPLKTIATESLKYNDFNFIESLLNQDIPDKIIVTKSSPFNIETHLNNERTITRITNISNYLNTNDNSISFLRLLELFINYKIDIGSYMHLNQLNINYEYLIFHYRLELSILVDSKTFSWWSTDPSNTRLNRFTSDSINNLKNTIPRNYDPINNTYSSILEIYKDNINNFNTGDICMNKFTPIAYYVLNNDRLDTWMMDPNTGYIMVFNDPLNNFTTRNNWNTNTKSPPFFSFISYNGYTGFNNINLLGTTTVSGGLILNNNPLFENGGTTPGIITSNVNIFYGTQDINLNFIYNFNTRFPIYANIKYTDNDYGTQTIAITTDKFNFFYNKNIHNYFNDNINNNSLSILKFREYLLDITPIDNIQFLTHETSNIEQYGTGKYNLTENEFFQDIKQIFTGSILGHSDGTIGDKFNVFLWNKDIVDLSLQEDIVLNYNSGQTPNINIKDIINAVAPVMHSFFISNLIKEGFRVNDSSINSILEAHDLAAFYDIFYLYNSINTFTAPYMIDLSSNNDFSINGGILINIGLRSLMIDTNKNYLIYGIYIYDFKDDGTPYNNGYGFPEVELIHFTVNANTVSFLNKFYSDRIYINYEKLNDYWLEKKSRPIGYKFGIDLRIFIGGPMSNNNIELRNFNISFTKITH